MAEEAIEEIIDKLQDDIDESIGRIDVQTSYDDKNKINFPLLKINIIIQR